MFGDDWWVFLTKHIHFWPQYKLPDYQWWFYDFGNTLVTKQPQLWTSNLYTAPIQPRPAHYFSRWHCFLSFTATCWALTTATTHNSSLWLCTHSHVKLPSFVARLYLEDIKGTRVTCGGLHLKNVCGNTAARGQVHVSVQDGEGLVSAGGVLSWTHALTVKTETALVKIAWLVNKDKCFWEKAVEPLTCH